MLGALLCDESQLASLTLAVGVHLCISQREAEDVCVLRIVFHTLREHGEDVTCLNNPPQSDLPSCNIV